MPRTITFGHDLNGSLVSISTSSSGATTKTTSFFYDVRDRLTQVTLPDGRTVQNEYYPDSPLRLSFTDPGGVKTSTVWDPITQDLAQDLDSAGAVMAEYIQGTRIDDTVGMVRGGSAYAYIGDHLNSIRALIDGAGAVQNRYRYEAFGSSRLAQEGVANRLRFTAREWEPSTATQYNRRRHYMPQIGRWTQRDPVGFVDGFNRYVYVRNEPVSAFDPLGLLYESCRCRRVELWMTWTKEWFSSQQKTGRTRAWIDEFKCPGQQRIDAEWFVNVESVTVSVWRGELEGPGQRIELPGCPPTVIEIPCAGPCWDTESREASGTGTAWKFESCAPKASVR